MHKTNREADTESVEEQNCQGQAAMDEALALPITRLFVGAMAFATFFCFVVVYQEQVFSQRPLWQKAICAVTTPLLFGPVLLEMISVVFLGRSRMPWYREIINRWHTRT